MQWMYWRIFCGIIGNTIRMVVLGMEKSWECVKEWEVTRESGTEVVITSKKRKKKKKRTVIMVNAFVTVHSSNNFDVVEEKLNRNMY